MLQANLDAKIEVVYPFFTESVGVSTGDTRLIQKIAELIESEWKRAMESDHSIEIYTDGSCKSGGRGGWGSYIRCCGIEREVFGGEPNTTPQRMELTAAIRGIEFISAYETNKRIRLFTDSQFVQRGMLEKQAAWKANNWNGVPERDLWRKLYEVSSGHSIDWVWVRGHNGNHGNERADRLANRGTRLPVN